MVEILSYSYNFTSNDKKLKNVFDNVVEPLIYVEKMKELKNKKFDVKSEIEKL